MDATPRMTADPAKDDLLILVNGSDQQIGTATKLRTHVDGLLHRAFSVVLVRNNAQGKPEMLLAKRAACKYHSAGLWANSCCSHPRAGEELLDAAYRRVHEELGCEAVNLREISAFAYRAQFPDGICEYEYDHVLVGTCEGELAPNPSEASDVRWISFEELAVEFNEHPERFAVWAYTVFTLVMRTMQG